MLPLKTLEAEDQNLFAASAALIDSPSEPMILTTVRRTPPSEAAAARVRLSVESGSVMRRFILNERYSAQQQFANSNLPSDPREAELETRKRIREARAAQTR